MSKNRGMEIGAVIRKIRQSKGLTLEEVAYAAGTDGGNLSRIERGLQRCVYELLEGIASGLGMTVAEFYLEAEALVAASEGKPAKARASLAKTQLDQDALRYTGLISEYEKLTESNQKLLLDFIQLLQRQQKQK